MRLYVYRKLNITIVDIILKSKQNLMADLDYNIHSDPLNLAGVGQIAGHTAVILDSIEKVKLI